MRRILRIFQFTVLPLFAFLAFPLALFWVPIFVVAVVVARYKQYNANTADTKQQRNMERDCDAFSRAQIAAGQWKRMASWTQYNEF